MAKNLVIVESPAKAKTIERYLGKDYRVEASMGHVRDLPQKKLGVEIDDDFRPTYTVVPGKKKVLAALKKAAVAADAVFMATDLDREGEAIAWHLCEALGLDPNTVSRVTFNEITRQAIEEAFARPGRINMDKVSAQEARRILDRLVGYKLSPLLWKKVAKGLSAGRVQSVAVRLVVEREREIRDFASEEFWKITALLSRKDDQCRFKATLTHLNGNKFRSDSAEQVRPIAEALRAASYKVRAVHTQRIPEKPPPPFITSQLQQAASSQLGFSPRKTMTIAQQLYQGVELGAEGAVALITYMRTDSYHIAPGAQAAARDFIAERFGPQYVPHSPPQYRSRGRAQEAHEAIRPTDVTRTPESVAPLLNRDEARLYELIWKRFVASQMRPALWDVTNADIEAASADGCTTGLFKARGRVLVYDGHTRLTGVRMGQGEQQLPPLAEAEPLVLHQLEESRHFTQPPPRYTEATLVKKLESLGIGRPSTYATIISTIQDRGYVVQHKGLALRCTRPECDFVIPCDVDGRPVDGRPPERPCRACGSALQLREGKRCLYATQLGEVVTDKLVEHFQQIMDYKFTSHMEEELDDVEEARTKAVQVIREFWDAFSAALRQAGEEMESEKHQAVEAAGPCPQCQAPLVKRWSRHGPFLGCSKYPECDYTRPLANNGEARPEPKRTDHACPQCGANMILRYNRRGEPFLGCEKYPHCRSTMPCDKDGNPIKVETTGQVCPKCGAAMVVRRSRRGPFLGCSAYPKCRGTRPLDETTDGSQPAAHASEDAKSARPASARRARSRPIPTDRDCPDCGSKLVIRTGRRGRFLGCSKYPKCRHTEDVPADLQVPDAQ